MHKCLKQYTVNLKGTEKRMVKMATSILGWSASERLHRAISHLRSSSGPIAHNLQRNTTRSR